MRPWLRLKTSICVFKLLWDIITSWTLKFIFIDLLLQCLKGEEWGKKKGKYTKLNKNKNKKSFVDEKKTFFYNFQGLFLLQLWKIMGTTFKRGDLVLFRMSICCSNRSLWISAAAKIIKMVKIIEIICQLHWALFV